MIKISFLGTNSGLPTKERNVSSISLVLDNETYLIDCGEATQHQVQKSDTVNFGKISKIFITHLHGDHVFGLPGLLASVSNYNNAAKNPKEKPKVLDLYGPLGIRKMLFTSLMFSDTHLGILVRVHELVPPEKTNDTEFLKLYQESFALTTKLNVHSGMGGGEDGDAPEDLNSMLPGDFIFNKNGTYEVLKQAGMTVRAAVINHRVFTVGYVFQEDNQPGKLDAEKLKKMGIKQGPTFGKLKNGLDVTLDDGTVVKASDVIGPEQKGRKVVILGDTCDASNIASLAQDCDAMTHETTLTDEQEQMAVERGHSTPKIAAAFARKVNCKRLILTHYSARFVSEKDAKTKPDQPSIAILKEQAEKALAVKTTDSDTVTTTTAAPTTTVELAEDFKTFIIERSK